MENKETDYSEISKFPLCEWDVELADFEVIPYLNHFPSSFEGCDFFEVEGLFETELLGFLGEELEEPKETVKARDRREKVMKEEITFEELAKYFRLPITQAARELKVGLTLLKKRCRELNIPRWPHRKIKSLDTLIRNIKELVSDDRSDEEQSKAVLEILQEERKSMEAHPDIELENNIKRLRQACFKAKYKKRKLMIIENS